MFALMILMASIGSSSSSAIESRVDLIELNHFYDDLGRHAYDQVILYEWSPDYRRHHVIAWMLLDESSEIGKFPQKEQGSRDWIVKWYDRDAKTKRIVRSKLYRETWSQVDPERENKQLFDEKYRTTLPSKGVYTGRTYTVRVSP